MRKIHTTIYLGFSIFICLLMILIVIFFFRIIENKNRHTRALMTTLENKMTEKKNIDTLIKKIDHINKTSQMVNGHFVEPTKIDDLVGYLEKLGDSQSTKLSVKEVIASKNEPNKIEVKISIEGEFPNLMKSIGFLENSPYQISVDSVYLNKNIKPDTLTVGEEEQPFYPWQADLAFNILSLK